MTHMPDQYGYLPLVSPDKTQLVQIFVDLETGLIDSVYLATRVAPWGTWGPPTKLEHTYP